MAPLAAAGLILAGRRRLNGCVPVLLGIGSGLLVAVVFFTPSRLRLTTALLPIPFAALGVVEAARRLRAGGWRALLAALGALAVVAGVVLATWSPMGPAVRDSDYTVGGVITLERARARAASGRIEEALRTIEVHSAPSLPTCGGWIRRRVGGRCRTTAHAWPPPSWTCTAWPRRCTPNVAKREEAWDHARHARILQAVAAQYTSRRG